MIKLMAKLEHIVGEKVGHFICDQDTPVGAAKEMCQHFMKYLDYIEETAQAHAANAQAMAAQDSAEVAPPAPVEEKQETKVEPINGK